MRKIISLCVMISVLVSSLIWSAQVMAAPLTMSQIYAYAKSGDISSLERVKDLIDTIGNGGRTALCQAVYNFDYEAYYNLKSMGASKRHPCVNKIPQAQINYFNQGYYNWAVAVNEGTATAPAGLYAASEGAVIATETGLSTAAMVGIGVGAAVVVGGGVALAASGGGGGGSKNSETTPAPDPCADVNCGEHGSCFEGSCICTGNYYGTNCEKAPLTCHNGGTWNTTLHKCDCISKYTGPTCEETETPSDPCAGINCGDHGTCNAGVCNCTDGYSGATCNIEPPSDPCAGINCGDHGICNAGVCNCSDGYSGTTCNIPPDPCAGINCGEHGTCNAGVCNCSDGYSGTTCDIPPDPCAGINCGDHGTCNAGVCNCSDGYSGTTCNIPPDPCAGINCGDHGTCNAGVCNCSDGYSGTTCNIPPDPCAGINCGEHGTCNAGVCNCSDGYSGTTCNIPPDPCAGINCGEHGTCDAGECKCTDNYYGPTCQSAPLTCQNGGTWNTTTKQCDCPIEYTGSTCEEAAVDFPNLDVHPVVGQDPDDYTAQAEFGKGNFLTQINAQDAYSRGYNGYIANKDDTTGALISNELTTTKIKVGILDDGFDVTHPDLSDNIAGKYNFDYGPCRGADRTHCYGLNGDDFVFYQEDESDFVVIDAGGWTSSALSSFFSEYSSSYNWDNVKNDPSPHDMYGNTMDTEKNTCENDHGTHVAGIVAATQNEIGMMGVSPNADLVVILRPNDVFSIGSSGYEERVGGLAYKDAIQKFQEEGTKVINMSFGTKITTDAKTKASYASEKDAYDVFTTSEVDAYKIAAVNDIVMVRAAGNDGNDKEACVDNGLPLTTTFSSGTYDLTNLFITVVAADKNDKLASYSNICGATKGYCMTAPGGDISRGKNAVYEEYEQILNDLSAESNAAWAAYCSDPTDEKYDVYYNKTIAYNEKVAEYNNALAEATQDWGIYSTVQNNSSHNNITEGTGVNKSAYGYMQGTSMATPVVTGSVALLMSAYPHLSNQQVVEILFRSANKELVGWGGNVEGITDSLGTWVDSFGNEYAVSSIYGHGMVDLEAATKPLGELQVAVSSSVSSKQSISNAKLALPRAINTAITDFMPKSIMGLDDYNRPFATSIEGKVRQAYHNPDTFKHDFKSFMYKGEMQTAGVKEKLSFAFSTTKTDQNLMGYGILDVNYRFNNNAALKFSYRSDIINENNSIDKALANPFMNMTDSYSLAQEFNLKDVSFTFGTTVGKNAFYETNVDKDDEFKRSVQAFNTEVAYRLNEAVNVKVTGGILQEKEALLGMNGTGIFATDDGRTYFTGATMEYKTDFPVTLSASYYYGRSSIPKTKMLLRVDDVASDSFAFDARYQPDNRNTFGLQLSSPLRIRKGNAVFKLPVARDLYTDEVYFDEQKTSLKPQSREYDFGLYYMTETNDYDWRCELMMRSHPDHMSDVKPDYRVLFGLSYKY